MPQAFRIPADDAYTAVLGRAIYNFTYYEWVVVHTIEKITPGYLQRYTAKGPTAGSVAPRFIAEATAYQAEPSIVAELQACATTFNDLRITRDQLLHAHPYHPDARWPVNEVEAAAHKFDDAACALNYLFYRLWP
jgi:hypothetical protein